MWATVQGVNDPLTAHLLRMAAVVAIASVLGWTAARILDPGVRARGLPLLTGLVGLTSGTWLVGQTGWDSGPAVLGYALLPSFLSTLSTCLVVKLLTFGVTSSR